MKKILGILAILLLSSEAGAQTVSLAWDYDKVPTEVATYTQEVKIDNTVLTTAPVCVAKGTTATTCSVSAPSLATGSHTVSISATRASVTATTVITGIGGTNAPSNPSNHKVVITVTITGTFQK